MWRLTHFEPVGPFFAAASAFLCHPPCSVRSLRWACDGAIPRDLWTSKTWNPRRWPFFFLLGCRPSHSCDMPSILALPYSFVDSCLSFPFRLVIFCRLSIVVRCTLLDVARFPLPSFPFLFLWPLVSCIFFVFYSFWQPHFVFFLFTSLRSMPIASFPIGQRLASHASITKHTQQTTQNQHVSVCSLEETALLTWHNVFR